MKKTIVFIITGMLLGFLLYTVFIDDGNSSAQSNLLELGEEKVESIIIYTYDFDKNKMERHWAYRGESLETQVQFFSTMEARKLTEAPLSNLSSIMYGIKINEENSSNYKELLISGNYAVTTSGEWYEIDGEKAKSNCTSLTETLNPLDSIAYVINHRALSIHNGKWIDDFMIPTIFLGEESDEVVLEGGFKTLTQIKTQQQFTIANNSQKVLEYGDQVWLEAKLNDTWYQIDDMIIDGIGLVWHDILNILEPGTKSEFTFYLEYYQPLPIGEYRIVKEFNFENEEENFYSEFNFLVQE